MSSSVELFNAIHGASTTSHKAASERENRTAIDLDGFYPLDGKAPGGAPNETISRWTREPLNVSRLRADRLPVSAEYAAAAAGLTTFDYIRDHLGYRIELRSATHKTAWDTAAEKLDFEATLTNFGFGAPVNPRPVQLVLLSGAGSAAAVVWRSPSFAQPQAWQPYVPHDPTYAPIVHTIGGAFEPPTRAAAPPGTYSLGLAMPDLRPAPLSAAAYGQYSLRLANAGVPWRVVHGEGINEIGSIEVR